MKAANWAGLSSRDEKAHALVARGDAEGHRLRNFVPKLGSIGYYHATCNSVERDYCSPGNGTVGAP
jgi:hypothetical protein